MHDGSCFLCTNTCFFHVSPTPEIYTLSLHDALPISLKPGAYGFGFVGGKFILMDLAANNLIEAAGQRDAEMKRPVPLQVLASANAGSYRLHVGRDYIEFRRAN